MTLMKLRNKSQLGLRSISISLPDELILKLNSHSEPQERSAYIGNLLVQHFSKLDEQDPRYILKQKQQELTEFQLQIDKKRSELERERKVFELSMEEQLKKIKEEILQLEIIAQEKMKELTE